MQLNGEQLLPVGQQHAWAALTNIEVLRACMPGCESLTRTAQGSYLATIHASVGPVRARFLGTIAMTDINEPNSYILRFDGNSGPTGFVRGQAHVVLRPDGPDRTFLLYASTAQVGGRLAQVGSRLIDAAAGAMSEKFFVAFSRQLTPAPGVGVPAGAVTLASDGFELGSFLWAFLRRVFGKD
ncbi:MAG TPA: carbon monoxide dehydrogenase subunit G [Burkholderiaceae bacterium]|nr:carbon monoxide dehydrogenase subunit G [Burkholderiaceae bacterium]